MKKPPFRLHVFVIFCLFGAFLAFIRFVITGKFELVGLVWNLILALFPYLFALMFLEYRGMLQKGVFVLWFLFFPNALYIWTDFIHLRTDGNLLHFDIVYIGTMAIAGLIAGFASLEIMHLYWKRRFGSFFAWMNVSAILIVALFGVFIGRFLRFNSWDIFREPLHLFSEIQAVLMYPNTLPHIATPIRAQEATLYSGGIMNVYGFILLYFCFYMLFYAFLYHTNNGEK